MGLLFEWHPRKAFQNQHKHGVSFQEASTVFADPFSATLPDPEHSYNEERFIIIGLSKNNRLLMVAHTERGDTIRIISARELTPSEGMTYEQYT